MSFDLTNLHAMIVRASHQRNMTIGKVMRVSLQAAADRKFALRNHSGSGLELNQAFCDFLRRYAAEAEAQDRPRWWTRKPWSVLRHLFVNEAEFGSWLDHEASAGKPTANAEKQELKNRDRLKQARRRPQFERAAKALATLYPNGVPDQAIEPNVSLCRRVGATLKDAKLPDVSDDTILRAAGRSPMRSP
jgi:hypothetical protein